MSTVYHAKFLAYDITRQRPSGAADKLSQSIFNACVKLNPHQIEAAHFALKDALSKGVILADEVGLGKTIEGGLVLCQLWAERRRRLLIVCPASLRKQWSLELLEKFNLPNQILDSNILKLARQNGNPNPFLDNKVIITSINFASRMEIEVRAVPWDLVIIDEAHKLRNSYRQSSRMGQRIRNAIEGRRKLLLTATPLQNSLLELYGLSSLIDERIFGDASSFRAQYMRQESDLRELKNRIQTFIKRTLRRDVIEYISYTRREALTRPFKPTDDEQKLYEAVSAFLMREDTYAIPSRQRNLITLILRKLLASSSNAISGTLETMRERLTKIREELKPATEKQARALLDGLIEEEDIDSEILEEEYAEDTDGSAQESSLAANPSNIDLLKLENEIRTLELYSTWAKSIGVDTKSRELIKALNAGFAKMQAMGAPRKALIFTESRRTQSYLKNFLEANGYIGKVVLFSGTNSGPEAQAIYDAWLEANASTGRSSGSKDVDIRTALIEHFRDKAEILIATEAAAEGVNMQFCSLIVNYDLPWNPQRIEQRIGRCHRYGQKYDVVVINFINERNEADQRVYELLAEKFLLFDGVFGASDEVLGSIETGVDFEKKVLEIYQRYRTSDEIQKAFNSLQDEMDQTIQTRMEQTRKTLLEYFDEEVHNRLNLQLYSAQQQLDLLGQQFWTLTKFLLADAATFNDEQFDFELLRPPESRFKTGRYELISKAHVQNAGEFLYRLSHPLGEWVLEAGKRLPTPTASLTFHLSQHSTRIAVLEKLAKTSGWLKIQRLEVKALEKEEHLLISGFTDDGKSVEPEDLEKLFRLKASVSPLEGIPDEQAQRLAKATTRSAAAKLAQISESNQTAFTQEREKLERWAEDLVLGLEKDLKDTKEQIKVLRREARQIPSLDQQLVHQEKLRQLEQKQRRQRQEIFNAEDEIMQRRDKMIESLEKRLAQQCSQETLFTIRWTVN